MNRRQTIAGMAALAALAATATRTEARPDVSRDYVSRPEGPWRYFSDQVMGGVSEGTAEPAGGAIRLTGTVSTRNRGGFIQVRTPVETPLPAGARGVALEVRGNGERYFVHLRTRGTRLPWQYYQAGFATSRAWREVRLPFDAFRPSGKLLRATPRPGDVTSIGVVAYGRDHEALLELRRLWIF